MSSDVNEAKTSLADGPDSQRQDVDFPPTFTEMNWLGNVVDRMETYRDKYRFGSSAEQATLRYAYNNALDSMRMLHGRVTEAIEEMSKS